MTDCHDGTRVGAGEIDHCAVMADQDVAAVRAIVSVQAAQQRGLADTRWSGQDDAFAGMQFQTDPRQDGDAHAALQMEGEALRLEQSFSATHCDAESNLVGRGHSSRLLVARNDIHACSTELTSNCV